MTMGEAKRRRAEDKGREGTSSYSLTILNQMLDRLGPHIPWVNVNKGLKDEKEFEGIHAIDDALIYLRKMPPANVHIVGRVPPDMSIKGKDFSPDEFSELCEIEIIGLFFDHYAWYFENRTRDTTPTKLKQRRGNRL
jgi:hypothetical protein